MHAIKNELCERLICLGNIFRKYFIRQKNPETGGEKERKEDCNFQLRNAFKPHTMNVGSKQATVWAASYVYIKLLIAVTQCIVNENQVEELKVIAKEKREEGSECERGKIVSAQKETRVSF